MFFNNFTQPGNRYFAFTAKLFQYFSWNQFLAHLSARSITCTLIPGDGPGISLAHSLQDIFSAAHIPVGFETIHLTTVEPDKAAPVELAIGSILRNGLCIKGIGDNRKQTDRGNIDTKLKEELGIYGKIINAKSVPFVRTRHHSIDMLICTERVGGDEHIVEYKLLNDSVLCLKTVQYETYRKLAHRIFRYAKQFNRKKIHFIHKATIFKLGDGVFLNACRGANKRFSNLKVYEILVDNCAAQLVMHPDKFDVLLVPNIYADILVNLAAGLVGGAEYMTAASFSDSCIIFEPVGIFECEFLYFVLKSYLIAFTDLVYSFMFFFVFNTENLHGRLRNGFLHLYIDQFEFAITVCLL